MLRPLLTRSVVLLALLGLSLSATAGDWPQWRGPNRDGISDETGLLTSWGEEGPPLAWKAEGIGGGGWASVVVAKGKIFTLGESRGTAIVAIDQKSGEVLWKTPIGRGGGNCTPTYADGLVYGLSKGGDFACVDAESGDVKWKKNLKSDFGGQMMSGWGYSESPLIDGDRVICTPGGNDAGIVALDRKTGKTIWKAEVPGAGGAGYASIVIAEVGGIKQYLQLFGGGLFAVDAKDGRFLWKYNRIANGTANIPTSIVKDNYVFCSTGYGTGSALLKLTARGKNVEAEEVYFLPGRTLQNHHGGMIRIGDYIYCGHGHNQGFPICIKMLTGEIAWSKGRGPGSGSAAITYADGHLYFRYENSTMALIEAKPDGYKEKSTFKIPEGRVSSWQHPVIADGKLYLRSRDGLLCYDVKK